MRLPRISPSAYRTVTLVALVALSLIIVSGAAVRLTGSGLGCPDWPTCADDRVVAPLEYHAMVEFVNRVITGLVSAAVIVAVLGSLVREPRRRDLTLLSAGLVAGVAGQVVLGGLTVLFELAPPIVMAHFIVSMILLLNAVVLSHRAGQPDSVGTAVARPADVSLVRVIAVVAAVVIVTGTVVTAAGPHGGDEDVRRLDVLVRDAARVHGAAVIVLVGLVLLSLLSLRRHRAPRRLQRLGVTLLVVILGQAALGYVQYFTGVPEVLVGLHVAGATAVWIAAIRFNLGTFERPTVVSIEADDERAPALVAP